MTFLLTVFYLAKSIACTSQNELGESVSSSSSSSYGETVHGVVGPGEPEASIIGVSAIGAIIIGGFVVCSLPKT